MLRTRLVQRLRYRVVNANVSFQTSVNGLLTELVIRFQLLAVCAACLSKLLRELARSDQPTSARNKCNAPSNLPRGYVPTEDAASRSLASILLNNACRPNDTSCISPSMKNVGVARTPLR